MASSIARSPFCSPEEDPFLLLESAQHTIEWILFSHAGRPLRRTWIEHPYGEEEICLLEEEVLPVIARCMARVHQIDDALESEQLSQQPDQELLPEEADAHDRSERVAQASTAPCRG